MTDAPDEDMALIKLVDVLHVTDGLEGDHGVFLRVTSSAG